MFRLLILALIVLSIQGVTIQKKNDKNSLLESKHKVLRHKVNHTLHAKHKHKHEGPGNNNANKVPMWDPRHDMTGPSGVSDPDFDREEGVAGTQNGYTISPGYTNHLKAAPECFEAYEGPCTGCVDGDPNHCTDANLCCGNMNCHAFSFGAKPVCVPREECEIMNDSHHCGPATVASDFLHCDCPTDYTCWPSTNRCVLVELYHANYPEELPGAENVEDVTTEEEEEKNDEDKEGKDESSDSESSDSESSEEKSGPSDSSGSKSGPPDGEGPPDALLQARARLGPPSGSGAGGPPSGSASGGPPSGSASGGPPSSGSAAGGEEASTSTEASAESGASGDAPSSSAPSSDVTGSAGFDGLSVDEAIDKTGEVVEDIMDQAGVSSDSTNSDASSTTSTSDLSSDIASAVSQGMDAIIDDVYYDDAAAEEELAAAAEEAVEQVTENMSVAGSEEGSAEGCIEDTPMGGIMERRDVKRVVKLYAPFQHHNPDTKYRLHMEQVVQDVEDEVNKAERLGWVAEDARERRLVGEDELYGAMQTIQAVQSMRNRNPDLPENVAADDAIAEAFDAVEKANSIATSEKQTLPPRMSLPDLKYGIGDVSVATEVEPPTVVDEAGSASFEGLENDAEAVAQAVVQDVAADTEISLEPNEDVISQLSPSSGSAAAASEDTTASTEESTGGDGASTGEESTGESGGSSPSGSKSGPPSGSGQGPPPSL